MIHWQTHYGASSKLPFNLYTCADVALRWLQFINVFAVQSQSYRQDGVYFSLILMHFWGRQTYGKWDVPLALLVFDYFD